MLLEKDRAVIADMCRTGMSLEVLKKSFPQFTGEDIEAVYNEQNSRSTDDFEEITISCNCS